jgi:kynurenine 3-monooxygenase
MNAESQPVAIVGAGLAGCLLAAQLGARGIPVELYERRADPRLAGAERGRSINLAISARGLAALDQIGLRAEAMARSLPMRGRTVHPVAGETSFQPYSADGRRAINSIGRAELNRALLDCAGGAPSVKIYFEHRLTALDPATGRLSFETPTGRAERHAAVVLGCDGAFSATRAAIQFREGFDFSQEFLEHGYKELTIPAGPGGRHRLDPGSLHIWPRTSAMMIALPNVDGSFTCTLFWPRRGEGGLESLTTPEQIGAHFARQYPDAVALMPTLVEDYLHNPVGSLVTVRCWPWVSHRVALVGDAAHAIVPFYGQGANAAMEDCVELVRCLDENGGEWAPALDAYQRRRKPNADAIAGYALDNFVEMRDRVNSRLFRLKTAVEHALERRLGGRYLSRYELVSFTTVPYAEIAQRLRRQNLAVVAVLAGAITGAAALAVAARSVRSGPVGRR